MSGLPKRKSFILLALAQFIFLKTASLAETSLAVPPSNPSNGKGTNASPSTGSFPRGIQVFDDRVFDLGLDKPADPKSGAGRALDAEPEYNTEQRRRWIQNCSADADKSSRAFRDCYGKQKAQELKKSSDGSVGSGAIEPQSENSISEGQSQRGAGFPQVEIDRSK